MAAVVVLLAAAFVLWQLVPRDRASHITRSQAVQLFERNIERKSRLEVNGGRWPELGVYRYETSGQETIDTDLLDGSHDYDGISTLTLWPGRCGMVERWQVLDSRWSETETCGDRHGREEISSLREFHEFLGSSQEDRFDCEGWSGLSVVKSAPSRPVTARCRSAVTSSTSRLRVVGTVRMEVGGEAVDAVHMEAVSVVRGESSGSAVVDEWRRRSDGLLLRRRVGRSLDSEASGGFRYDESYSIRLLSLVPER
jgi:hypothetical protein